MDDTTLMTNGMAQSLVEGPAGRNAGRGREAGQGEKDGLADRTRPAPLSLAPNEVVVDTPTDSEPEKTPSIQGGFL
jgi:hypothetical protein